jgi:acyl carrier protein
MVSESIEKAFSQENPEIENIRKRVEGMLFELIEEVNEKLPEDQRIAKGKSTQLFGEGSVLDSLGLVNLIVAFEQKIQSDLGFPITLADERAMAQKPNPFRSIELLVDYAAMLIKEKANG